jgi:hypothetical protein
MAKLPDEDDAPIGEWQALESPPPQLEAHCAEIGAWTPAATGRPATRTKSRGVPSRTA